MIYDIPGCTRTGFEFVCNDWRGGEGVLVDARMRAEGFFFSLSFPVRPSGDRYDVKTKVISRMFLTTIGEMRFK